MSEKITKIILFDIPEGGERPALEEVVDYLDSYLSVFKISMYDDEEHARQSGAHSDSDGPRTTGKIVVTFEFGKMDAEREHENG